MDIIRINGMKSVWTSINGIHAIRHEPGYECRMAFTVLQKKYSFLYTSSESAINEERGTRDPLGIVGSEKNSGASDVSRQPETRQGGFLQCLFNLFGGEVVLNGCFNISRTDGVDSYAELTDFQCGISNHIDDSGLRRCIRRSRTTAIGMNRGDLNNPSKF